MAANKNKKNSPNAYDNRSSAQFPRGGLPPIVPQGREKRPLTRAELMEQQRSRAQFDRKRAAVGHRKEFYHEAAKGKKKKVDPNKQYRIEKQKRIKKGRDYFFVMRKLVCFLMFLMFAVSIGIFVVGYLNVLPPEITPYTSLFVEPDYTPDEERISEEIEGEIVEYLDKSKYFTTVDPIFGLLNKLTGKNLGLGESPKYDEMAEKVEAGVADKISEIAMTYYPIAMLLFIITALVSMIRAFFAIFGRRVYRFFGLNAIWMVVLALIVIIGGVASNMSIEQSLDFSQLVPFITSGLITPADAATAPLTAAGYGLLGMIAVPVIILILSLFAKKKVPYSIFD